VSGCVGVIIDGPISVLLGDNVPVAVLVDKDGSALALVDKLALG
jgi:hypothetical protein